ncbi:Hypothetical protein NCS54_00301700 [Fusarium falciforme]|uniref:Hypothetical protein n=1 Tax=Fusarium falciforme TaxID=195108 RepID=UPI002300D324|nr:Hypothetical protein NCS54_00301700 [Fusarium falciforme]KAJ4189572.1 hypothetical protein NW767_011590 [Fusarium falciforme]WAO85769.1 Hypothetical protein NCS54_00301700 [Fusarium falciforme]
MPQDPNLYGQRAPKKQKRDATLSSSLDFTAQLTSLMSNASGPTSGRSRPSKDRKEDIFKGSKPKRSKESDGAKKLQLKEVAGTEEETKELARARRRMEEKARLYAAMKRGDYVPKENEAAPLVDFDRKWAEGEEERKEDYATSSDEDADDSGEMVEYEDEFGRVRQVTKAERDRLERRARRGLLGAEELERMSARPSAPSNLIYGDAVQSMAFNPEDPEKMEELARKRDRSATPPPDQHYDADWEIRTKGTGFYKFSKDEETRTAEMEGLAEERRKTEEQRRAREDQKEARRREIEKRREDMAARRAKKQADSFLDKLGA